MKKYILVLLFILSIISINAEVKVFKSESGVDVVYDFAKEREISSVTLLFDGGTANYPKEKSGVEKFLFEMVQKGSTKYSEGDFNRLMDNYGMKISYNSDYDMSSVTFTTFDKYFPQMLEIVNDILQYPSLDDKNIEIVRKNMTDDISAKEDNPDELIWLKLNEQFFRGHQYLSIPDGYAETVKNIKKIDLLKHLNKLTSDNRVVISIVTGIPLNKGKVMINSYLGFLKNSTSFKKHSVEKFNNYEYDTTITAEKSNLETYYVASKFIIPSVTEKSYTAARIGLSIFSKRIYEILRTKHGLTYAAYAGASNRKSNYGVFYVSTSYPDSAVKLFYEEVENVKNIPIKKDEIDDVRNIYETSFYMNNELSSEKSFMNGYNYLMNGDYDYNAKFMKNVEKLKVEDITEFYRMYLKNFTFLILK